MTGTDEIRVRQARHDDAEAVAAFTSDTWPDREGGDYVARVFDEWVEANGPERRTFVLDAGDDVAGLVQGVLLSEYEAWAQGMRINPDYRGRGLAKRLNDATVRWARERGAAVLRIMIFSWNAPALGLSRSSGFRPVTEFRWATPTPDPSADPALDVTADPDGGWAFWTGSDARATLCGLALDPDESWAVSELTRERLIRAADEDRLLTVRDGGTRGLSFRIRTTTREGDGDRIAEYAVGAWADLRAAEALFAAIARDAASVDADRARVFVPEGAQPVSDAVAAGAGIADHPDFVMAADLTDESVGGT